MFSQPLLLSSLQLPADLLRGFGACRALVGLSSLLFLWAVLPFLSYFFHINHFINAFPPILLSINTYLFYYFSLLTITPAFRRRAVHNEQQGMEWEDDKSRPCGRLCGLYPDFLPCHLRQRGKVVVVLDNVLIEYLAVVLGHFQRGMSQKFLERKGISPAVHQILSGKGMAE